MIRNANNTAFSSVAYVTNVHRSNSRPISGGIVTVIVRD
jgi:hypothetical protein